MAGALEDEKIILKKEVFLSILFWSVLSYASMFILNIALSFILSFGVIKIEGALPNLTARLNFTMLALSSLFFTLIPIIILAIIFYIALKRNWQKLGFIEYKLKATYLLYIFIFMVIFDVILNIIITKQIKPPRFSLLAFVLPFIIPQFIKTESNLQ